MGLGNTLKDPSQSQTIGHRGSGADQSVALMEGESIGQEVGNLG